MKRKNAIRTVGIRTAVALFSHRCRIALLAFAHLTFALLSHSHCCRPLRTVGIRTVGFALVSFALLSFALLSYKRSRRDALQLGSRSEGPGGCTNSRTKNSAEQFRYRRIRRRTCSLQLSEFMTTSISWDARRSSGDCQCHGKWKSKASEAHFLGVDHRPRNDGTGKNSIESDDDSCVSKAPVPAERSRSLLTCPFLLSIFCQNERIS